MNRCPTALLWLLLAAAPGAVALAPVPPVRRAQGPPVVIVESAYPGASPDTVIDVMVRPLELHLDGAPGIRRLHSVTTSGRSVLWAELKPGADVRDVRRALRERLRSAREGLPGEARFSLTPAVAPDSPLLLLVLRPMAGTMDRKQAMDLRYFAESKVRPLLLYVFGVAGVHVYGGLRKRYEVVADPKKLAAHRRTLPELRKALAETTVVGVGGVVLARPRISFKPDKLGDVIIAARPDGEITRLRDLAVVRVGAEEPREEAGIRLGAADKDGGPAVILAVTQQPGVDRKGWAEKVEEALKGLRRKLPRGVALDRAMLTLDDLTVHLRTERVVKDVAKAARTAAAALLRVPEVRGVWWALVPRGAEGWSDAVVHVRLRPDTRGEAARERDKVLAAVRRCLPRWPGMSFVLARPQPAPDLRTGEIKVRVFGKNSARLRRLARQARERMGRVRGVVDLRGPPEELSGLQIIVDGEKLAPLAISAGDLTFALAAARGGVWVAEANERGRRSRVVLLGGEPVGETPEKLGRLPVGELLGQPLPLRSLARIERTSGPAAIYREGGRTFLPISCNVQGRDAAEVVAELRKSLAPVAAALAGMGVEHRLDVVREPWRRP